jgi:DNA-directed RNA polymerase sigma subunit (sigma70/sigma32)
MTNGLYKRQLAAFRRRRARALRLYEQLGADGRRKRTLEEIGKLLGCSKVRAGQIIKQARAEAAKASG